MMKSILEKSLEINPSEYAVIIQDFLKRKVSELKRAGILVPISGGLDSSVVATLCVNAIGKENVSGLLLPEKEGNPEAEKYASMLAKYLDIKTKKIDISPVLKKLGTFDFILSRVPTRGLREKAVKLFMDPEKENILVRAMKGDVHPLVRNGIASFYTKQRIRMVVTYKYAEENNLLVAGSAHKTEDYVGLYVKFGVDDTADVMPLRNLFRTQILQLAGYIKVPGEIIKRTPNPDLVPGVSDKYVDILGIDAGKVDMILAGIEQDIPEKDILEITGFPPKQVQQIISLYHSTAHMRNPSMAPRFS
ncbi:MAG: NAD(+) synthase [Spirochaetales bacterium]|nr:NAD(+) synthase [Spirochaetales bacterium]